MEDKEGTYYYLVRLFLSDLSSLRTFTFWRFLINIPLGDHEMAVRYSVNAGQKLSFVVPGRDQNMRWAAHSVRHSAFLPSV